MNATHSQGQWEVDNYGTPELLAGISAQFVVLSDDGPVAYVYTKADARLLAAAPELLEALMLAESVYRQNCVNEGEPSSVLDAMQAAIAKATGEQA